MPPKLTCHDPAKIIGKLRGMIWTDNIDVKGTPEQVFAAFTGIGAVQQNFQGIIDVQEITGEPGKVGYQVLWHFLHDRSCLEMVETVVEIVEPTRIASAITFTGLLPLPKQYRKPNEMIAVGEDLDAMFRFFYGKKPVEGLVLVEFSATGAQTTCLTHTLDLKAGGITGFFSRFRSKNRPSPLYARLQGFRDVFEARGSKL